SVVDYYDEAGRSAKKFLVRKPVLTAIMRSGFGVRRHPLLGYMKMHTGVDWAAPNGTPIYASGNGTVEKVGWESGYGKYVRLRHTAARLARRLRPDLSVATILFYAAAAARASPLKTRPRLPAAILISSPSLTRPLSMSSASGS